jgi:hypothetical protein
LEYDVLERLLRIIASNGTECSTELARRLGVSHTLMENMLDELTRLVYLKAVEGERSIPCGGCPMHTACLFDRQARIWALRIKGERLLEMRADAAS